MDEGGRPFTTERPGSCHSRWRMSATCVLSALSRSAVLSGSQCVVLVLSGTFQHSSLLAALSHKFRVCTSSECHVCKCCQRKRCGCPEHVHILDTHIMEQESWNRNNMYNWISSDSHAQRQEFPTCTINCF